MKAKKSFGQHFLVNRGVIEKIAASVPEQPLIIEIGPGTGVLTEKLVERFGEKRLILIEADKDLIGDLEEKYPDVTIEFGDAAKVDFDNLTKHKDWVLVGNLPYNAAAAIMEKALKSNNRPKDCIIMVQKEQAQRMYASAGDMSVLSVAIQIYGSVKKLFDVSPGSFNPPPKVQSTVLHIKTKDRIDKDAENIIDLAKTGFQARRKKLSKNLMQTGKWDRESIETALEKMHLNASTRAQELSVNNWIDLYGRLED